MVSRETTVRMATVVTSPWLTVRMLPNRKESTLAWTRPELMMVMAIPTERERTMTRVSSAYRRNFSRSTSISRPKKEVRQKALMMGLAWNKRPVATPARDAWLRASPIME